jgi:hypothetical protein
LWGRPNPGYIRSMTKRSLGVAAVFLAGCAVGGVSGQIVVPKASAQQAATLTRWEYRCEIVDSDAVTASVNPFGAQGWELSGVTMTHSPSVMVCFKRPKL